MKHYGWYEHFQMSMADILCRENCDGCEECYRDYSLGVAADIFRAIAILAQELIASEDDADQIEALGHIQKHAWDIFMMYRGLRKTSDGKWRKLSR